MRHIIHADLDAFYTSVEQLDDPKLRGKPVIVGGSPESRGVVASASYEVRCFGVRSAMPMATALRLCPVAVRRPANFPRYREVSRRVMTIFREFTDLVEPVSLDEAYLDVTESVTLDQGAGGIARRLKERVRDEVGLTISVGVATRKSVAKIASEIDKPDGFRVVPPGSEREFLSPLSVGQLWGIGPKRVELLRTEGIHTIGELAAQPEEWFIQMFGSTGPRMRSLALGDDDREVEVDRGTKSISSETTLSRDTGDGEVLRDLIGRLSQDVALSLKKKSLRGRTVKVKLRLSDFTTFTRQRTVAEPVESPEDIARTAMALLEVEMEPGRFFRLVGVGVSGFDHRQNYVEKQEVYQLRLSSFQ